MYKHNRDIILIIFFGFIYYAITVGFNRDLTQIPLGKSFVLPFVASIFMGFALQKPSQLLEWPLSFMFGGIFGAIMIIPILGFLGLNFSLSQIGETLSFTLAWFGTHSVLILSGLFISNLVRAVFDLILGSLRIH